jgi:hypothetical protein
MTARRFVPWVEQLESRVMLTVMADVMPYAAASSGMIEAAAISTQDHVDNDFDVVVRDEDTASGHVLVVEFKNLDQPRTVGILGGDIARTAADGTVRLRQPSNVRSIELTISDANGVQQPFLQVDLNPIGHVISYRPIATTMVLTGDHNTFHGTVDQLSRLHANTAHAMSTSDSTTGVEVASSSHSMDGRVSDEALAHLGMPNMANMANMLAMTLYNSGAGHLAAMSEDVAAVTQDDSEADVDTPNYHDSTGGISSAIQVAMAMLEEMDDFELIESADFETPEADDVDVQDAALVSWVQDMPPMPTELSTVSKLAQQREHDSDHDESTAYAIAALVEEPLELPAEAPSTETQSGSLLPTITSSMLAVACAAGVFVLERKADQTKRTDRAE